MIKPIGRIKTPYKDMDDAPHQADILKMYTRLKFLKNLEGYKDLHPLDHPLLDKAKRDGLIAVPPNDGKEYVIFVTRPQT